MDFRGTLSHAIVVHIMFQTTEIKTDKNTISQPDI